MLMQTLPRESTSRTALIFKHGSPTKALSVHGVFRELDLVDEASLDKLFCEFKFDACVHFAGLKAVGESVSQPLRYYQNNIVGTLNLLNCMGKHK
jgi:UDP-glucose 4-epimerase